MKRLIKEQAAIQILETHTPQKKIDSFKLCGEPKMTFDYKKPFTTADGRKARLLADDINNSHQLAVAVEVNTAGEHVRLYRKDGTTASIGDALVNIPERKERWRSVFSDYVSSEFETRDAANEFVGWGDNLGLLRIVYEDDRIVEQEYLPLHGEEK